MFLKTLFECFQSVDVTAWLVVIFLFLLVADIFRNRAPPNFPPGPQPLPFVGNVFTGVDFKTMEKLAEKYGPVFSLRRGNARVVFVSGFKMVKEALVTQLDSFADRPITPLFHVVFKGIGIISSSGYLWKMQRKFASIYLRNFGEGKTSLEKMIQLESTFLCEAFKDEQERPFNPHFLLNNAVGNVISSVVFGHRFDYNDESFQKILRLDNEAVMLSGSARAQLYDAFPDLLKHLPGPHQTIHSIYGEIMQFLNGEIEKHQTNWDPKDPRDFIDSYLIEIDKRKEDPHAGFNLDCLAVCTLDMIEAGTESSATTLRWAMVYLMNYPEIQERVHAEIDRVIGPSRQPTMADRPNLPYTDAVIHEVQRMGNIVPLNGPRMAVTDTMLGGYVIPKGTSVIPILTSVLFDKTMWETPNTFNPGHFLDADGKLVKREAFLPFSAGKRACLGEGLARMELFLFFVSLFQKFSLETMDGAVLSTEGIVGTTLTPKPFEIYATTR